MNKPTLVRFEPYFNEWVTMEKNGTLYSVEFDDDFEEKENPQIIRFKSEVPVENACSIPIVVQILLTKRCNYRCPHCPVVDNEHLKTELTTDEVKSIIDYCASNGVLFIRFSGGESSLRKDFPELAEYAISKGLHCGLLSNSRNYSDEVLNVLPKLSYMQTHLDSVDENRFNKLTGGDNFTSFCKTLQKVRKNGVRINAATTLMEENLDEIQNIMDFCKEYDLILKINTIYSDADGKFKEKEWTHYYKDVITPFKEKWPSLKEYATKIGLEVYCFIDMEEVDNSVSNPMFVISPWGRSYIIIDSEGDIYPFPLIIKPEFKLGNIRQGDDLIDVWRKAPLLKQLRSITKETLGCNGCNMDCVYSNIFFSYSYFGEFGHVLPNNECPYGKHKF